MPALMQKGRRNRKGKGQATYSQRRASCHFRQKQQCSDNGTTKSLASSILLNGWSYILGIGGFFGNASMETIPAGSTIARSIQPCQQKDGDQAAIIYGESAEGHETVVKIKKRGIRNVYCDFDK